LNLDVVKFQEDFQSQEIADKVRADQQTGLQTEIPGTPFVLLNGLRYDGPRDLASLESILQLFKLKDRQFTYCPPMQIDPQKQYIATIKTEKGDIKIQLFADKAPMAVNSFVFLARSGWFDDISFHRVVPGFAAQAGDPSETGMGGPGYSFDDEISDLTFDRAGLLGMANAGPGSNGSQFFISLAPATQLNGKYTIFGEVIEGMNIVEQLTPRDPQQATTSGDPITTITIEEK
jgi:cyclophilin family peptidyl-prolyl cis-trans isomerase